MLTSRITLALTTSVLWAASFTPAIARETSRTLIIEKPFLNFPVASSCEQQPMRLKVQDGTDRDFLIRLASDTPDYWVFSDVSSFIGKTIELCFPEPAKGLELIYQSDTIHGSDSLYQEPYRPQFHFSTQRGWINDPNGLVYADGEYHLFYQHNPYERDWQNMHWGHAVSADLIHWQELPTALYPDELGTMFSGSAVVDTRNTSGFQTGDNPPLVVAYTSHSEEKEVQCIAFSNDRGRTFTKYAHNPVIDSSEKWNSKNIRDPKLFWHKESGKWIMVLFEKTGLSFYNSDDLKSWQFQSHLDGFWECPELFPLPVDGDITRVKWVIYGASGTYALGSFDGRSFAPETDKLCYTRGDMYAAQTFNNLPDAQGRRIQIGWGRIEQHDMPFNSMMTFPTQLTLRSTREGVRLYSEPIGELETLHRETHAWHHLSREAANENLQGFTGGSYHLKLKVKPIEGTGFRLRYQGNSILHCDSNYNELNGRFYGGDQMEENTFYFEILVDKTSVEIFADHGKFSLIQALPLPKNESGFVFETDWQTVEIEELEIHTLDSIW